MIQRFHTAESPIWEGEITIIGSLLLNPQVKMELLETFRDQLAAQAWHREWGPTEWFYQHRCERLTSLVEDRIAVYGKAEPEKALLSASPEMIFRDEIPAALHHISRALSGVNLFEWHLAVPPNEHADAMRTHAVENLEALSHNPALAPEHRTQIRRLRVKAARWTSSPARILGLHPEATPAAVAEPDPSESVGGGSDLAPTRARCHDLARSGVEYWRIVPTSEAIAAIGEDLYLAPDVAGYLAEIAIRLGENAECARTLAAIADEDTQLPLGALVDTSRAIVGESDPAPA